MKVLPSSTFLHSFFSVPPRLNSITEFPTPFICLLAVFSLWTSSLCPCSFLVCQKNFQFCLLFKFVAETETPSQCTIESNSLWSFLYCLFQFKPFFWENMRLYKFGPRSSDLWKCKCDFIIFSAHFTSRLDSMKCCCVENKVKQACNNKSKSESHIWLNKNSQLGPKFFWNCNLFIISPWFS